VSKRQERRIHERDNRRKDNHRGRQPDAGFDGDGAWAGGSVEEKTDAGGNYRLVVVPGTIKVTVATTHFYLPVHESVALAANETLVLDFVLVPRNERQ